MVTVPTPERLQYANTHEHPFYIKKQTIFTSADHPKLEQIKAIQSLEDIKNLDLTVVTYVGNGWNEQNIVAHGIRTYHAPYLKNVWRMLANKRGDIAIEWPVAAWSFIEESGLSKDIVQTDVSFAPMSFHLLISKQYAISKRLSEFDAVILQMKRDGTIDAIVERYMGMSQP
ncbi:hypothetical protein PSDVSF_11800 [Pseudodesulfovibrio sediminis]|uniref:Solute-binding protein family 3/N-terminal domain-containing protein n=2 Tax=Pseudodesulfovibrio sediminis TaxID=2810563 RepID=A0ABN6ENT0_9BACT|nr:hypothetical protein PSDVSF_11800 [Pseudodesulfovibrio sediminis]